MPELAEIEPKELENAAKLGQETSSRTRLKSSFDLLHLLDSAQERAHELKVAAAGLAGDLWWMEVGDEGWHKGEEKPTGNGWGKNGFHVRFEAWKKGYKVQLSEAAAKAHQLGLAVVEKNQRKWWRRACIIF